jgi:hypothetical protein
MIRKPQSRRGVVILVVLSLLVLFVLLVVTYAIIAGQYRRAAQSYARKEWLGEDPQKIADRVMYALVREPDVNQTWSSLRGHSLLRDVYGGSVVGTVSGATTFLPIVSTPGGQILQFAFTSSTTPKALKGFYNGSVLTFVKTSANSRQLQGVSTRIVGYDHSASPATYTLRIMNPMHDGIDPSIQPQVNDEFVINFKPFVGTGFGYVGTTAGSPRLSVEALKPNRAGDNLATFTSFVTGGANESYDAPDYQNMIMAAVTANGVLPSFHRPELITHWIARDPSSWNTLGSPGAPASTVPAITPTSNVYAGLSQANRDFRRKLIFRPMPWDHPDFTGSNSAFDAAIRSADEITQALVTGPWDIDNDGDGFKDSIWIDPDLPVQTTEDGRTYKPLVAILCVDMDGRLNVNAHGHYGHLAGVMAGYPLPQSVNFAGAVNSQTYPKGQGYGPPEVDLNKLLNDNTQYQVLLASRYGTNQQPGQTGYDALMPFKFFEYPTNYFSTAYLTSFSSNMDLRGLFASGVDYRGQPLYEGMYDTSTSPTTFSDLLAESPYEFNLNKRSAADAPFTIAELEKVLRLQDFDSSSLQSRLTDASVLTFLQGTTATAQAARRAVTTDSWDMPVPGVVAPDGYDSSLPLPQTIMELLAARLSAPVPEGGGFSGAALDTQISKMLWPDLIMGLRMDINRPIGNGRDDNSNAVVDEAYGVLNLANMNESLGPEYARIGAAGSTTPAMAIDHNNDGVINNDPDAYLARSHLARHLYVLLMLLRDKNPTETAAEAEANAQILAQWAVNAVDFRDADSIMTAFKYDWNPFNGWDESGPEGRIVWGCERPELLITETLAFHDRRTEDLDTDKRIADPEETPPNDFDQRLLPRGSLFVELYNPWAGHDKLPGEFYHSGTSWSSGVLLNRVNSAGEPVWRLAITAETEAKEPTGAQIERAVYFNNPVALVAAQDSGRQIHYTSVPNLVAPLLPGRYAVVGSPGDFAGGEYVTAIGRRNDAAEGGSLGRSTTRQIVLAPNPDWNVNQVKVRNNLNPPANQTDAATVDFPMATLEPGSGPAQVQPAIAIPIDLVPTTAAGKATGKGKGIGKGGAGTDDIPLSISEPAEVDGWYPETGPAGETWDPAAADNEGAYNPPLDQPLDSMANSPLQGYPNSGTLKNFRYVHLQRLANPLAPYNPVTNPYRTIDIKPVDLTIFNGVESTVEDPSLVAIPNQFGCSERGANGNVADRYLWPQEAETAPLAVDPVESAPVHRFGFYLRNTLGYLNSSYGIAFNVATAPTPAPFAVTSYLGAPNTNSGGPPFPWLTWNNRPYASPTELLLVPRFSSAQLLRDIEFAKPEPYIWDPTLVPPKLGRFPHLLPFFAADPNSKLAQLYRLFEYVTVRPRFAGTETLLNPSTTSPHFGSSSVGTEMLHPPFNWISTYREPGRINLNTIYDSQVWDALWASHPAPMSFSEFVDSRRGYGAAGSGIFVLDQPSVPPLPPKPPLPTFFGNVFRAPGTSLLIPPNAGFGRLEVDNTLLRTSRTTMEAPTMAELGNEMPRMLNSFTESARNSERNPFFSYQGMQRLSNLVTTRSNVYALWITIGYFEVEPNGRLVQEVGLDTGTVTRNRAFYIIDRSIPVAFDPGQNHNVDKCVLVRRFIE